PLGAGEADGRAVGGEHAQHEVGVGGEGGVRFGAGVLTRLRHLDDACAVHLAQPRPLAVDEVAPPALHRAARPGWTPFRERAEVSLGPSGEAMGYGSTYLRNDGTSKSSSPSA